MSRWDCHADEPAATATKMALRMPVRSASLTMPQRCPSGTVEAPIFRPCSSITDADLPMKHNYYYNRYSTYREQKLDTSPRRPVRQRSIMKGLDGMEQVCTTCARCA